MLSIPRRRVAVVCAVAVMLAMLAVPPAAARSASEVTPTLGTARGLEESSMCGDGSVLVGMSVAVEPRNYVSNVAAICRDAEGAETTANGIGPEFGFDRFDSRCADDDVANGIAGRAGEILDAVGVGCEASDGALVGGGGGNLQTGLDCAEGWRLVGLEGTYVDYFGQEVVSSLTGVCQAYRTTTYEIQVGQAFFEAGAPGFSGRFYPGSIVLHQGDTLHFAFPAGLAPAGGYPQELMGANDLQIGAPGSFFLYDPDEGADRLKFDLDVFGPGDDCGTQENPCVWGPNSEVIFPAIDEESPDIYVTINAAPGTTLWAASLGSPEVNVNFKAEVVDFATPASTQEALDARAASLLKKDYEDALALHRRMGSKRTWHINKAGKRVYDVFVGASGGPIELLASYPKKLSVPKGARVQFHFMSQVEPHTATFGGAKARNVFFNFLIPACDPDGDEGSLPDADPIGEDPETGLPVCPEGTTLEGDVHPKLPWAVGDGKVTSSSDYENSGLIFPRFPDEGSFDVNPSPWTERFPKVSDRKGFKFICLIHGGFMGGRVRVIR